MLEKGSPSPARIMFGKQLRARRRAKDLTLEDLAELSGLHWSYISEIEGGKRNITIDNMWRLAAALELEVRELL